ncbi:AraC family transcriptional regulator [Paenibacillus koleovorans]|uniref:AraC family transcriptional regulator n=1 Tax=Paenibacillus koleovorans TaxID=121608 RepID=UPI000FDB1481|nr:AraC family transcriptional regulator [Paenibacillus koleovorans]
MNHLYGRLWMGIHWIMELRTEPDWRDIRRNVNGHTFYWVRCGKGRFIVNGERELAVIGGMLFYLKPGLKLQMESDPDDPLVITMVLLMLQELSPEPAPEDNAGKEEAAPNLQNVTMRGKPVEELELPFMTELEGEERLKFDSLFDRLLTAWVPGQPVSELLTKAHLHQLLYDTAQLAYSGHRNGEVGPDIFRRIKEELEREYAHDLVLQEVAARHGISVSYLRELFVRYMEISPKSYLDQVRNEHAKRMLAYTINPIKEIGERCGYNDEYHFSKRFKQMNGMSPSAYRAKIRAGFIG